MTRIAEPKKARSIVPQPGETPNVVINTSTGERGDYAAWVACFADGWKAPRERLGRLLDLLSPNVTLIAPVTPAKSIGRTASRRAFERTFAAVPDLKADVLRWCASGDIVFIEMRYSATVAKRALQWVAVDRFLFRDGEAVERVAYFNPDKVRRALLRNPTGWRQLLRLRAGL